MWDAPPLKVLQQALASPSEPVGKRMRAAYFLRQAYENNQNQSVVVETLGQGLLEKEHGSLMRHEFGYVMGQLRDERCCEVLERVLGDETDCTMVRHETAEALGAIGAKRSIPVLEETIARFQNVPELAETCQIALDYIQWNSSGKKEEEEPMACACMTSPYSSIDPAPPHPQHANLSTEELGQDILCNVHLPLFDRYRAMFSLRNLGSTEAVVELGKALVNDDSSALFRHEVAYVLGQLQHGASVKYLEESLRRTNEHVMVRHEAAEALGAIESKWDECERVLKEFSNDPDEVVRQSCLVALDAADYWGGHNNNEEEDLNPNNDSINDIADQEYNDKSQQSGGEEKKDSHESLTATPLPFVLQKAVTNGRKIPILNHFNVTKAE